MGAVLARAGLYTVHHPFTMSQSKEETERYGQSWDLDVSCFDPLAYEWNGGRPESVEVKSVSLTFHNRDNYPHDGVLVCSQKSFLKKWPGANKTGRDFLFVSRPTGAILWLPKNTPIELGHDVFDASRNELYKVVKTSRLCLLALDHFVDKVKHE